MKDLTGLEITVHNQTTLDLYNTVIADLCRFKNPVPITIAMLEAEPDFVMGQVFNGHINLWTTDRDDLQWSLDSLQRIARIDSSGLNTREKMHVAALQTWAAGDLAKAAIQLDEILIEYPLDILALLSGHQLDFFLGDAANLRGRVYRVLPAWDKEHPLYGYLLGMLSFGQEEAGHYEQAEMSAREAVERNPQDVWGIHAVAHALEMQNKYEQGARFMQTYQQHWQNDNVMVSHNAIHHGLFLLETGELNKAIAVYDNLVHWADIDPIPMALVDASSVLWRLYLEDEALGNRAQTLTDSWKQKSDQLFYSFNDAHAIIAFAANNDAQAAQTLIAELTDYVASGDPSVTNHGMSLHTGLPVCEAIFAFSQGDYNTTIEKLMPIKNTTAQFGGSHAQRDIFARTLLEAALRAGNKNLALALVNERLMARPHSPYNQKKWQQALAIH
ncbi:tetratricopeptide repeat protein [Amphritea sp. 1_MG-2023]|uniref:tetratricopeptide repeat protein n=1 Tax=Amphritea sp. 1_MG-2023 TaxID=3062670 RepID=UPI0026E1AE87|nr:tetratricopeptide repeat protein [Amphritea sp. 1_MG-2023]MDO6563597.1 tetratricopeptide repeat protein [Amphritea sp. 1_MG-2023]